jgi:hypothetical protein
MNQSTSDLLINMFKGYGACSDEVFRAWLTRKQDDHEEGNSITPDELMLAATTNKFDAMIEKGTWNAPTAEEKIVALEAKVTSTIKSLNKKVSFEMGKKEQKERPEKPPTKAIKEVVPRERSTRAVRRHPIPIRGIHPRHPKRRRQNLKATPGTGVEKRPEDIAKNGGPTSPRSARHLPRHPKQTKAPILGWQRKIRR